MKRRSNTRGNSASRLTPHPASRKGAALLWDDSFLWGLMAYRALRNAGLPFDLIRAADIRDGRLRDYRMLFVPGGWASNKLKTLQEEGVGEIRRFVRDGGNYLGFCGGAGLATEDGINLLPIKRKPTKERVPSFSGPIQLSIGRHSIWKGVTNRRRDSSGEHASRLTPHPSRIFHAWWPSQFLADDDALKVLARYCEALPESFSSDLNVGDVGKNGDWDRLESLYGINLDPKRLLNDPAVIEGRYGKGRVVLSLIHFDTPDDNNGAVVLRNLWDYLSGNRKGQGGHFSSPLSPSPSRHAPHPSLLQDLETAVDDLIALGIRNFLWFWRNPMLLQWRRGIRGLEYCTLHILTKELSALLRQDESAAKGIASTLRGIRDRLLPFVDKAKELLIRERLVLQNSHISYERCDVPEIQRLRAQLFSTSKSYGGEFKGLIDEIDGVLYSLLEREV